MRKKTAGLIALAGTCVVFSLGHDVTAKERVFIVRTRALADFDPGKEFQVIAGPHFLSPGLPHNANGKGLRGGGRVRDYNLGEPTYGRHINGVVTKKDFDEGTFEVYTASEIDTKYQELQKYTDTKAKDAKQYAADKIAEKVVATLNKVVKDSLPKQAVEELKAAVKTELKEELRGELKRELRREVTAELLQDKEFLKSIVKGLSGTSKPDEGP